MRFSVPRRIDENGANSPTSRSWFPGAQSGRRKKVVGPIARREAVGRLQAQGTSLRRACRLIGLSTATWRYQRQSDPTNRQQFERLQAHAAERPRFGYRRLHTLVDREGLHVNHKRVYCVYRAAGLQVRRRRRKRLTGGSAFHCRSQAAAANAGRWISSSTRWRMVAVSER
jgi:HTH-like domain